MSDGDLHRILFPAVDDIVVPDNRQRREFPEDAQQELLNDIQERGLLNPIIVRGDGNLTLVTGERRLRAIRFLASVGFEYKFQGRPVLPGTVPTLHLNNCTELEAREAELAENLVRKDLTWQEVTRARAELHRLRSEQATARGEKWTPSDTAKEIEGTVLKGALMDVSRDIHLEEHLDDPEVSKAKSQREAVKLVRKKLAREARRKKAEEHAEIKSPHTLMHQDSYKVLPKLSAGSFDIILTDPPYGQGMHEGLSWGSSVHRYDDSPEAFKQVCNVLPGESMRLLKEHGHAYVFCSFDGFPHLAERFSEAGFDVWPKPIIWYKGNVGSYPRPFHGPRLTYECILYAIKGDKRVTQLYHDVIVDAPNVQNQEHPAGKPVELYRNLLRRSAQPGDRVLDMFCGKGTIFPAASAESCIAVGIEKDPDYHALALEAYKDAT